MRSLKRRTPAPLPTHSPAGPTPDATGLTTPIGPAAIANPEADAATSWGQGAEPALGRAGAGWRGMPTAVARRGLLRRRRPPAVQERHGGSADPVEAYAAALGAVLHGPKGPRERMVEEIRSGLADAVDALVAEGAPEAEAARRAVREFGPVAEVAAACQDELTVAQARHTSAAVALAVPLLVGCWSPLWSADPGHAALALALPAAVASVAAALLAVLALATTGPLARVLPTPRLLPRAVAWTGTAAAVSVALGTAAFCLAGLGAAGWPLLAFTAVVAAYGHGKIAASARLCRACAALPTR